ncbi:hypothetical protein J2128_001417 [Methanomicrobium sp. W14]|uniref:hypothetical protein n=1 Tax=Methanomicrobium sp. W14 TaxID=2817839 RepID=UPI001AE6D221|nr:hypothetical protein [Methanomicrobium sp. W14]MBP2133463.1 hypothetical protein [Methanomicrobium sp. W14]
MQKLKAVYWDERTLFSKEKMNEYILILADLIKNWNPSKYDGTAYKLMSYFEEMKRVLKVLNDDFGEKKSIGDFIKKSDLSSYSPLTEELTDKSVWAMDRWGVAFIMDEGSMKTMNLKDMILG